MADETLYLKLSTSDRFRDEMNEITNFVRAYRQMYKITTTPQFSSVQGISPSEECHGEGYVALYHMLIPIPNGQGLWAALEYNDIRKMVLEQVRIDKARGVPPKVELEK